MRMTMTSETKADRFAAVRMIVSLLLRDLTVTVLLLSILLPTFTQLSGTSTPEDVRIFGYREVTWIDFEQQDPYSLLQYHLRLTVGGRTTSTDSPFSANYESLLTGTNGWNAFAELSELLYPEESYVIPGIRNTNLSGIESGHMVPQGLCIAGDFVLISAYHSAGEQLNSVIYVMDRSNHRYLTTIELNLKSHVGALAFGGENDPVIYIADSNAYDTRIPDTTSATTRYRIWKLPLSAVQEAADNGMDSQLLVLDDYMTTTVCPAFLCTYENYLFIGDFNYNADENYRSYMRGYDSATGEPVIHRIDLDPTTQGVSISDYNGVTYLITSNSYGRNNVSELKVRRLVKSDLFGWHPSRFVTRSILVPNMSEDIDVADGHILVNFESASSKYQTNNHTQVQIDRVLNLSLRGLIEKTSVMTPLIHEHTASVRMTASDTAVSRNTQLSEPVQHRSFLPVDWSHAIPVDQFDFDDKYRRIGKTKKVLL